MIVKDEIEKDLKEICKNILDIIKLKGYNKGKFEINFCGSEISIDFQPTKEKLR